jgi:hypothetical protein
MLAPSGTGKTTLAENLGQFMRREYTQTISYDGEVSFEALKRVVEGARLPPNETRVVPINIDHREKDPPSEAESAAIKRFLRSDQGARVALCWPETSAEIAAEIATSWETVAGSPHVPLPVEIDGPDRSTWVETAKNTLRIANADVGDLEALGVDPSTYDPAEFPSLGEFLRRISDDFVGRVQELRGALDKPVQLYIAFCTSSTDEGVLSQLTNPTRYGFASANALLDSTPDSDIGRYWKARRGLLVQLLVQMDVHVVGVFPPATIAAISQFGTGKSKAALDEAGVKTRGPAAVHTTLSRSDLGRLLRGDPRSAAETRGTPVTTADDSFEYLAEVVGFGGGVDKELNKAMTLAFDSYLASIDIPGVGRAEVGAPFGRLIPDALIERDAVNVCIEYTWRKGHFLRMKHRSDIAVYILTKVRNYGTALGWLDP